MNQSVVDLLKLNGKVAVVTGGAGLFGRQIVEALAEPGARTFIASRDLPKLEECAATYRSRGFDVTALPLDQGDEQSIDQLLKRVVEIAGTVDVLVNNAVLRTMKDWEDATETFDQSLHVNGTGVFMMTRAFGRHMASRKRGSIINISSIQGIVGPDFTLYEGLGWDIPPDYFFHKGGMIQLTRYAAAKLGPSGVRVNCISPGGFFNHQNPTFVERYNAKTFLGRMANDTDLKGSVVFLASDASAYVTGVNLAVDGGYTAK
jgi:NAD(P)-dependent dehydrogenase (short-subunit alcohol dehydrogenase family)